MSTTILGGIIFVVVFAGIILVHELGHFFAARSVKIEVEEFGFGIPPRMFRLWREKGSLVIAGRRVEILRNTNLPFDQRIALPRRVQATADELEGRLILRSLKVLEPGEVKVRSTNSIEVMEKAPPVKGSKYLELEIGSVRLEGAVEQASPGTEFTINWIPLGGFNRLKGEEDPGVKGGMAGASPWKRIFVLIAGALMNLLTGVIVYTVFFMQSGVPDLSRASIYDVLPGTPAQSAGFQAGDTFISIAGVSITGVDQAIEVIHAHPGDSILVEVERAGQTVRLSVTPQATESDGFGRIGVQLGSPMRPMNSIWEAADLGFKSTGAFVQQLLALPGRYIAGTLSPEEAQLGGPRTIWNLFQQAVARDSASAESTSPTGYTLLLIISLTISVGTFNLLPLPALDGGRIILTLLEAAMRRPIPAKYQVMINGVGMLIMIVLLGGFYIKDIINPAVINLP